MTPALPHKLSQNDTELAQDRVAAQLGRLFSRHAQGWGARGPAGEAQHVYPLVANGRLRPRLVRLHPSVAAIGLDARVYPGRRESEQHLRLKEAALWWMHQSGATDARLEAWFPGGKADAFSQARSWAVECGVTRIGKLQDMASSTKEGRFTLIPFQNLAWPGGGARGLLAVEFLWGDDLRADLYAAIWGSPTPSSEQRLEPAGGLAR